MPVSHLSEANPKPNDMAAFPSQLGLEPLSLVLKLELEEYCQAHQECIWGLLMQTLFHITYKSFKPIGIHRLL